MIEVFCDGSSTGRSNKEGGWAYIIVQDGQPLHSDFGGEESTTNNQMELRAAIEGLLALEKVIAKIWRTGDTVVLVSDSEYTLGSARGIYSPKANLERVTVLQKLFSRLCTEARWVRGHSGNTWNNRCDRLAKKGKQGVARRKVLDAESRLVVD